LSFEVASFRGFVRGFRLSETGDHLFRAISATHGTMVTQLIRVYGTPKHPRTAF
jgi:hypothetical protein